MNQQDKQLLIFAGKAAGYDLFEDSFHDGELCYYASDIDCNIVWNPLDDDGDALRLIVKCLGFYYISYSSEDWEYCKQDGYAATRRAIVKAAAKMAGWKDNIIEAM